MRLPNCARAMSLCASLACAVLAGIGHAHVDIVRLSLAQLFLQADVVALARIDAVSDRDLGENGAPALLEVVSATSLEQFKGADATRFDFFLDAHGPASYRAGDTVVLFLEKPASQHPLARYVELGKLDYLSHQVRNTEHIVDASALSEYRAVLGAYAGAMAKGEQTGQPDNVKSILMSMLDSESPALVESGLIDWQATGAGLYFNKRDIERLVAMTRDDARPINLRLAILRTLASQQLVGPEAWDPLFTQTTGADLVAVIRSTGEYESRHFAPTLRGLIQSPSEPLAEAAARALGSPVYRGSEALVGTLLESESLRLNYAAVAALVGMNSEQAEVILQYAAQDHPNEKVRRLVNARLNQ